MLELNYPVLKLTKDFIRGSISSPKDLLVVGEINFEQGCFDDAILIDASGCVYRVVSAKKNKWTWNPWNLFKGYRTIWVSLELSDQEKHNLDHIREELLSLILRHPKWYKRFGESEQSLREKFSNARTIKELIDSVSLYS